MVKANYYFVWVCVSRCVLFFISFLFSPFFEWKEWVFFLNPVKSKELFRFLFFINLSGRTVFEFITKVEDSFFLFLFLHSNEKDERSKDLKWKGIHLNKNALWDQKKKLSPEIQLDRNIFKRFKLQLGMILSKSIV